MCLIVGVVIVGREDRVLAAGEGQAQHRRPRGPHLPARRRPDRRLLRLPLRGRGARHHPAAAPPEPADHPPHRQNDCRRVKVGCHPKLCSGIKIELKVINKNFNIIYKVCHIYIFFFNFPIRIQFGTYS